MDLTEDVRCRGWRRKPPESDFERGIDLQSTAVSASIAFIDSQLDSPDDVTYRLNEYSVQVRASSVDAAAAAAAAVEGCKTIHLQTRCKLFVRR